MPRLIPELDVSDLERSLAFYGRSLGFTVVYERRKEKFAALDLQGARLLLQEATGPGRRFRTAPLEAPYGRGINLQIEVDDVAALHKRILALGLPRVVDLEERWYRIGTAERGNRQFVVADPDGYLLRFFGDLGERG